LPMLMGHLLYEMPQPSTFLPDGPLRGDSETLGH
jgi:hypothetical protein